MFLHFCAKRIPILFLACFCKKKSADSVCMFLHVFACFGKKCKVQKIILGLFFALCTFCQKKNSRIMFCTVHFLQKSLLLFFAFLIFLQKKNSQNSFSVQPM